MEPLDDCDEWAGARDRDGYGRIGKRLAHRDAYESVHGQIPDGLTVDHLCFTKACVNPQHLRLLTRLENQRNQRSAHKTHCVNGHEFTPENTYIRPRRYREGVRDCRACIRQRSAAYTLRRQARGTTAVSA